MGVLRDWTKSVLPTFHKFETHEYFRVGQNNLLKKFPFLSNCPEMSYLKIFQYFPVKVKIFIQCETYSTLLKSRNEFLQLMKTFGSNYTVTHLLRPFFSQMKWQSAIKLHYSNCYFTWGNEGWLGNSSLHLWRHKN